MKLESKNFNNKEYTLVDKYEKDIGIIYHFAGDEDDIFCIKNNGNYEIITDSKIIDELMEECALKPQEIYFGGILPAAVIRILGVKDMEKMQADGKEKIIDEQVEMLQSIMDKKEIRQRLKKVEMYTADFENMGNGAGAFFHPGSNSIFFHEDDVNSYEDESKRLRLHETIHAITGALPLITKYYHLNGLLEGGTENIVEQKFGSKTSSYTENSGVRYNFSKLTAYEHQVALIRQMEFALGKDCDESILKGNLDFFNEFSKKYGRDLFRFINHRANRLLHSEKIKDFEGYIKETNNVILERVFNKDFENIKTEEEIEKYFARLRAFETVRARIDGDNGFREFYEVKIEDAKDIMYRMYHDKDMTDNLLKKIQYKEQPQYPLELEGKRKNRYQKYIIDNIAENAKIDQEEKLEIDDYKFMTAKKDETEYLVIVKDGKPISIEYGVFGKTHIVYTPTYIKNYNKEDKIFFEDGKAYFTNNKKEKIQLEENDLIQDKSMISNSQELQNKIQEKLDKNREKTFASANGEKQKEQLKINATRHSMSDLNKMIILLKRFFNKEKQEEYDDIKNDDIENEEDENEK